MVRRSSDLRSSVRTACRSAHVVKIHRKRLDVHPLLGFVLEAGADTALLHRLSDTIHLDGYAVFRLADVTSVDLRPRYRSFYERTLALRRERLRRPRSIELESIARAIVTAGATFPLITLHREAISPDTCSIGTIRQMTDKSIVLRWMTPGAKWDGDSPRYRLADITLLEFGGDYEDALARAAGVRRPAI